MIKEYYNPDFFAQFDEYISLENPFSKNYIYKQNNMIYGFMNYSIIFEKIELNFIWVNESYRNKGVASKLLMFLINESTDKENITLEVNINNIAAINLYKKFGFKEVAKRKNYYSGVDAILMIREMK